MTLGALLLKMFFGFIMGMAVGTIMKRLRNRDLYDPSIWRDSEIKGGKKKSLSEKPQGEHSGKIPSYKEKLMLGERMKKAYKKMKEQYKHGGEERVFSSEPFLTSWNHLMEKSPSSILSLMVMASPKLLSKELTYESALKDAPGYMEGFLSSHKEMYPSAMSLYLKFLLVQIEGNLLSLGIMKFSIRNFFSAKKNSKFITKVFRRAKKIYPSLSPIQVFMVLDDHLIGKDNDVSNGVDVPKDTLGNISGDISGDISKDVSKDTSSEQEGEK